MLSDVHKAMGGHVETGCEVFTLAIITVVELSGAEQTGFDQATRQ